MIERDALGHERSCDKYDMRALFADPDGTHIDLFCDCHRFTAPLVLENGTDIAWPAGWNEEKAAGWRQAHNLVRGTVELERRLEA